MQGGQGRGEGSSVGLSEDKHSRPPAKSEDHPTTVCVDERGLWPMLRDLEGLPLICIDSVWRVMGEGINYRREGRQNQCTHVWQCVAVFFVG